MRRGRANIIIIIIIIVVVIVVVIALSVHSRLSALNECLNALRIEYFLINYAMFQNNKHNCVLFFRNNNVQSTFKFIKLAN